MKVASAYQNFHSENVPYFCIKTGKVQFYVVHNCPLIGIFEYHCVKC